jgi:metallo-beta-lactamase family protein
MKLTFLGATKTVTGSKFLLETGTRRILFDCGLFQGLKDLRLRNWAALPVSPAEVDAVVLTHAHLDHSGYLPLFVRNGFRGPVFCTPATLDLCGILLPDSGYLQEEEAERANRRGYSKHHPALPLYTRLEAIQSLEQLRPVPFNRSFDLGDGLTARFDHAGHILGAAFITVTGHGLKIVFSGDLGRPRDPILFPPSRIRDTDYLLIESTYGDRDHIDEDPIADFAAIIKRTAARGGTIVIPANAVGRTQLVLHYLHRMKRERLIPDLPVWLDSPMARDATELFVQHPGLHQLSASECQTIFGAARIANTVQESKAIDANPAPKIVISASGMATGGRVLHHLARFAPDHRNAILFAGFQAAGTRGAALRDGADAVRIFGQMVEVHADLHFIDGLSAHADYEEMLDWLRGFDSAPRRTFIVHGEPAAAAALDQRIQTQLGWRTLVPDYLQTVNLDS